MRYGIFDDVVGRTIRDFQDRQRMMDRALGDSGILREMRLQQVAAKPQIEALAAGLLTHTDIGSAALQATKAKMSDLAHEVGAHSRAFSDQLTAAVTSLQGAVALPQVETKSATQRFIQDAAIRDAALTDALQATKTQILGLGREDSAALKSLSERVAGEAARLQQVTTYPKIEVALAPLQIDQGAAAAFSMALDASRTAEAVASARFAVIERDAKSYIDWTIESSRNAPNLVEKLRVELEQPKLEVVFSIAEHQRALDRLTKNYSFGQLAISEILPSWQRDLQSAVERNARETSAWLESAGRAYADIQKNLERSLASYGQVFDVAYPLNLRHVIEDLVPASLFGQASVARGLRRLRPLGTPPSKEAPVEKVPEDPNFETGCSAEAEAEIEGLIARNFPELLLVWRGASQRLDRRDLDWPRYYSVGIRTLRQDLVMRLAPDQEVATWVRRQVGETDASLGEGRKQGWYQNDSISPKLTWTARYAYLAENCGHPPLARLLLEDREAIRAEEGSLNKNIHRVNVTNSAELALRFRFRHNQFVLLLLQTVLSNQPVN